MSRVGAGAAGPFERVLGAALAELPEPVRGVHCLRETALVARGLADVTAAPGLMARLLCLVAGLPKPGRDVPCVVIFTPLRDGRERWQRQFADRRYRSVMRAAATCEAGGRVIVERFGPLGLLDLHFRLTPGADGLRWSLDRWTLRGVPLPAWSAPRIACLESGDGERFRFDIDVTFPLIGPVIHYAGWLNSPRPAAVREGEPA